MLKSKERKGVLGSIFMISSLSLPTWLQLGCQREMGKDLPLGTQSLLFLIGHRTFLNEDFFPIEEGH